MAACGDVDRVTDVTAEENLAIDLASQVVDAPYLANEELHARLAILEYLGLPYEDMTALFSEVERRISECMHGEEHSYSPMRGTVASLPVLAFGMSSTDHGYFPYPGSTATEIMLGQFDLASKTAIAERGSDSKEYFDALYGDVPEDLTGGCSGKAYALLGLDNFDSVLEGAVTRLQLATENDIVVVDSRLRFADCLGAERAAYIAALDEAVAATVSPVERSRVISEFAMTELGCAETALRASDAVVRDRVERAVQNDHQLTHEICGLVDAVGWPIPSKVAECEHGH